MLSSGSDPIWPDKGLEHASQSIEEDKGKGAVPSQLSRMFCWLEVGVESVSATVNDG